MTSDNELIYEMLKDLRFLLIDIRDRMKTPCEKGDHNYQIFMGKGSCTECNKKYIEGVE